MSYALVQQCFYENRDVLRTHARDIRVQLHLGVGSEFPEKRDYAYCVWEDGVATITVAPRMLLAPKHRVEALMRHELAHAYLLANDLEHSERECDEVAERLFGDPILYDADDVQTVSPKYGVHKKRPAHLPTGLE